MYCNWKVLISFGFIFWLALYLSDMYFLSPYSKIVTEEDRIIFYIGDPAIEPPEEPLETEDSTMFIALWSLAAFLITIGACFLLKHLNTKILSKVISTAFSREAARRSKSRIPIAINSKILIDAGVETESLSNWSCVMQKESSTSTNVVSMESRSTNTTDLLRTNNCLERDKIFKTASQMEKHYAKLREDLMAQEANLKRDQEQMQKRIESLCKDKRELSNKIAIHNKENKATKQQIEELRNENDSLNKRLENANKEIKSNIKTKKATLDKLEESLVTIDRMNKKMEQMARDKEVLANKFCLLEVEYKQLQEKFENSLNNRDHNVVAANADEEPSRNDSNLDYLDEKPEKDLAVIIDNAPNTFEYFQNFEANEIELSQSEIDIQKVQMKLINLEKSIEKLTLRDANLEASYSIANLWDEKSNEDATSFKLLTSPSNGSICLDKDCPLEHRDCLDGDCLEKQRTSTIDLSELKTPDLLDEFQKEMKNVDIEGLGEQFLSQTNVEVKECVESIFEIEKELNQNLLNIRKEYGDDGNGQENGIDQPNKEENFDESMRQWELRKGMVSNSPEFQKFLMKILDSDL